MVKMKYYIIIPSPHRAHAKQGENYYTFKLGGEIREEEDSITSFRNNRALS